MPPAIYGSILHGAYGDYYEQAVCLKHFYLNNPGSRMKLFAASSHRLAEFRALDFSWADCFDLYTELPNHHIDRFLQFQARDPELQNNIFSQLPAKIRTQLTAEGNRLPWQYLRTILPLSPEQQIGLSELGRSMLPRIMQANGIPPEIFQKPTIGFLWRHRSPGGAVKSTLQPDATRLVVKYARMFRRFIDTHNCHVLVCGMKVQRTDENMHRIDAKYPEYGLDLPTESCTHLKGLSWPLELEILSRCTVCVANPSGFSEALWIKRGAGVLLMDVPPHYLAKALWHRVPFFNLHRLCSLASVTASRWEHRALAMINTELERSLRQPRRPAASAVENLAS